MEEKDPRIGLKHFGPYHYSDESGPSPTQIKVGLISDGNTTTLVKRFLTSLRSPIASPNTNKWLYPDFLGFNLGTSIRCEFITSDNWNTTLRQTDIDSIISISNANQRIAAAVNLYTNAIKEISLEDDKPHVIVCALPQIIEERCGISKWTREAKKDNFTDLEQLAADMAAENQSLLDNWGFNFEMPERIHTPDTDRDFHNALKGKAMQFDIPIQILLDSTVTDFLQRDTGIRIRTQEPATVAWNFGTAIYYKANGKPWRLARLRDDTCYVGVSFFRNLLSPDRNVQTSMAQVFTHNGEGMVLRGTDVVQDEITRETHLSLKQAKELMIDALAKYSERAKRNPTRVVIHKTTRFSDEEKAGFDLAIGDKAKDYVTINRHNIFRFLRTGNYPVLRGTMVHLAANQCVLFTSGYISRVRTYPGSRIPEPLLVTRQGDSELKDVCKEIMGLTKLNWNTTAFATSLPITLEFAQKVGRVLSELDPDAKVQNHYRFYM